MKNLKNCEKRSKKYSQHIQQKEKLIERESDIQENEKTKVTPFRKTIMI